MSSVGQCALDRQVHNWALPNRSNQTEVRACRDSVEAKKGVDVGAKVVLLQRQAALVPDVHDSQNLPHHSRGVIPIQKR